MSGVEVVPVVDEGLGNSTYLVDLGAQEGLVERWPWLAELDWDGVAGGFPVIIGVAFWLPGKVATSEFLTVAASNYSFKLLVALSITPLLYAGHAVIDRFLGADRLEHPGPQIEHPALVPVIGVGLLRHGEIAAQLLPGIAQDVHRKDVLVPLELIDKMSQLGVFGLTIPEEYGGQGASLTAACAVVEEVAAGCASTAAILSVYALGAFPIRLAGQEVWRRNGVEVEGDTCSLLTVELEAALD